MTEQPVSLHIYNCKLISPSTTLEDDILFGKTHHKILSSYGIAIGVRGSCDVGITPMKDVNRKAGTSGILHLH